MDRELLSEQIKFTHATRPQRITNITTTEVGLRFSYSGERRTKSLKIKINKERRRIEECLLCGKTR